MTIESIAQQNKSRVKYRLMFVCMGNICRSPTAHAVMQNIIEEQGFEADFEIQSSGTHAYHIGEQADPRAQITAKARGIDMSALRAQKIAITDYDYFDWILAMDDENLKLIEYYAPENYSANCCLLMNFSKKTNTIVPDPYYGGPQGFEEVFDMVDDACRGLLTHLLNQND